MSITDVLLDDNTGDLLIKNGDFVIGDSDTQSIALLLESMQGDWKQFPLIGAGLPEDLSGPLSPQDIKAQITAAMKADAYKNIVVNIANGKIQVSGNH